MELIEARRVVQEALKLQETEIADGFASTNAALQRLSNEMDRSTAVLIIAELRSGGLEERQLSARLLIESVLSSDAVVREVETALACEDEPKVIRWLVTALGFARTEQALPILLTLSSHPSATVRFPVPDALSMCAAAGFNSIAQALLGLSRDPDADVRWSAIFELGVWLPETADARIVARLSEVADEDADEAVRAAAIEALSGRDGS